MNPEVNSDVLHTLPVLPLKNTVLFPDLFVPLTAGRPGSVAAVEAALTREDKTVVLLTQRDASVEQPGADDLYTIGTRGVTCRTQSPSRGDGSTPATRINAEYIKGAGFVSVKNDSAADSGARPKGF